MPRAKPKSAGLTKLEDLQLRKIQVLFKRSVLVAIMRILTMKHSGFRTLKSVRNINRLFANIDLHMYNKPDLMAYIWCISFFSKQWLDGIVDTELIAEGAKQQPDYDAVKEDIINAALKDSHIITEPEAKMIFDMIAEALQFGYLSSVKNEYQRLLDEIEFDKPGSFRELAERLFSIAHSLIDIKHNTNFVANKVTFNTSDPDSVKEALEQTMESLETSKGFFKVGIRRLNSLLSPGYMNGRLYVWLGLPGAGKSMMLLKSALDIRRYNPGWKPKTPGMKPCVLYITMENSFTETIERIWGLCFDDSIVDYTIEEAVKRLESELGIKRYYGDTKEDVKVVNSTEDVKTEDKAAEDDEPEQTLKDMLADDSMSEQPNIEVVVKYFSYREIDTDDLFTIIQDLRDDNLEVVALSFDYIKRIRPNVSIVDNVRLELDRVVNELKALAVLLDIPVITAHQMNRAAAATVDNAVRAGKGDVTKLVGRENVGDSWSVIEVADWAAVLNIEYKANSPDDRYMVVNVVKRRRIDSTAAELAKFTYLAHPFDKRNGFKLLDDMHQDKILSLQSLVNDIDGLIPKEKANAVPRTNLESGEFIEDLDDIE